MMKHAKVLTLLLTSILVLAACEGQLMGSQEEEMEFTEDEAADEGEGIDFTDEDDAADEGEELDFTDQLLVLDFSTKPSAPPDLEPLPHNRQVFKINATGQVRGALTGEISQSITEVHFVPPPLHQGVAISFIINTEQGRFEGYYTGSIHYVESESKWLINGYGQILKVTGVYADLFLAEVFVSSEVPRVDGRAQGEKGRMTISPR